jgi:hypothetical protein
MKLRVTLTDVSGATVIGRGKHVFNLEEVFKVRSLEDMRGWRFLTPINTPDASEVDMGVMVLVEFVE